MPDLSRPTGTGTRLYSIGAFSSVNHRATVSLRDGLDHAFAHRRIWHSTIARRHIVDHVLELGGGRDYAGHVRVRGDELEKKLTPAGTVDLACPFR